MAYVAVYMRREFSWVCQKCPFACADPVRNNVTVVAHRHMADTHPPALPVSRAPELFEPLIHYDLAFYVD